MPAISHGYLEWRKFILTLSPARFDLTGISGEVYGVLMDVGTGDGPDKYLDVSLYALNTGEASLKASPGAGVIGLGDIKELANVPQQIVREAQSLLQQTGAAKSFDYPEANQVFFYFLTASGVKLATFRLQELKKVMPFMQYS